MFWSHYHVYATLIRFDYTDAATHAAHCRYVSRYARLLPLRERCHKRYELLFASHEMLREQRLMLPAAIESARRS